MCVVGWLQVRMRHGERAREVRGWLCGVCSLPPPLYLIWGDSSNQACGAIVLPKESSCQFLSLIFLSPDWLAGSFIEKSRSQLKYGQSYFLVIHTKYDSFKPANSCLGACSHADCAKPGDTATYCCAEVTEFVSLFPELDSAWLCP